MDDMTCCPNGHRLDTLESRHKIIGDLKTYRRRKRCSICDYQIITCEVPFDIAKEVYSDD